MNLPSLKARFQLNVIYIKDESMASLGTLLMVEVR